MTTSLDIWSSLYHDENYISKVVDEKTGLVSVHPRFIFSSFLQKLYHKGLKNSGGRRRVNTLVCFKKKEHEQRGAGDG